ncbi:hypothetical protein Droror1_Dr00002162 [Drosera rotundifolia]
MWLLWRALWRLEHDGSCVASSVVLSPAGTLESKGTTELAKRIARKGLSHRSTLRALPTSSDLRDELGSRRTNPFKLSTSSQDTNW